LKKQYPMRPLHIIMPMAGEGSRFASAGWTTPKPLIELHGVPLFRRAIGSVAIEGVEMKYSFIVRQEHIDKQHIDSLIKAIEPDARVFSVLKTTRGAVETCLVAEDAIDDEDAIVVMDCDLEFRSKRYNELVANALSVAADEADGGALVSFESDNPRYSYAQIDEDGCVLRTAEKEPISNHALCGAYFFGSGKDFKRIAHQLLIDGTHGKAEFYVSLLYNYLLAEGKTVRLAPMEEYYSYGTPEELSRYL
jgi:dTDP-glucose pyrophosphorylase